MIPPIVVCFMNRYLFIGIWLLTAPLAHGQVNVTVSSPKAVGQKVLVELAMTNNLTVKVESARAICFLLDGHGKLVGESTKWVIGGTKDRPALEPNTAATFDFVITTPQQLTTTNLTARINFNLVTLAGGKSAEPAKTVIIENSKQPEK
jgi:hypothetical protein